MSTKISEYVAARLQAGDSPEAIETQLREWGFDPSMQQPAQPAAPTPVEPTAPVEPAAPLEPTASPQPVAPADTPVSPETPTHIEPTTASETTTPEQPQPRSLPKLNTLAVLITLSVLALTGSAAAYFLLPSSESESLLAQAPAFAEDPNRPPEVLSAQSDVSDDALDITEDMSTAPTTTASATTAASASESGVIKLSKQQYSIALVGDSMFDTLNDELDFFTEALNKRYDARFTIYNYGMGAQNAEMALERFTQDSDYDDRGLLALEKLKPDVIIINSFGYNPFDPHSVDRHWLALATLIDTARKITPQVYLVSDIAPKHSTFGLGSTDWTLSVRTARAKNVAELLQSTQRLAPAVNVPLIDLYAETADESGFGDASYTSTDGIHPNTEGKELTLERIAESLDLK